MFELNNEKTLMYSDDRSIRLTTHRVIHESDSTRSQVMLDEYLNYEFRTAHVGYYERVSFILVVIIAVIQAANVYLNIYPDSLPEPFDKILRLLTIGNILLGVAIFLLVISVIFLLISRRYLIRINGKFNYIEFRVSGLHKRSISDFLDKMERQANAIKPEKKLSS